MEKIYRNKNLPRVEGAGVMCTLNSSLILFHRIKEKIRLLSSPQTLTRKGRQPGLTKLLELLLHIPIRLRTHITELKEEN